MSTARLISERIRTAAILLTGVIPLSLQPGPVAAEALAERQVDRLLDQFPAGDGGLPGDVELQCHLISLVSDAVTLRAVDVASSDMMSPGLDDGGVPVPDAPSLDGMPTPAQTGIVLAFQSNSDEHPRGP